MNSKAELWASFSVADHCRPNAFAVELLLYDRLVVPVPADLDERKRWQRPNPNDPEESWAPDRLERLLRLLGTQHQPSAYGSQFALTVPWNKYKWDYERSRFEAAGIVSDDAFYATRRIIAMDEQIPQVVDVVAAYPSGRVCAKDRGLHRAPQAVGSVEEVAAVLARPMLLPTREEDDEFTNLREAIELAGDPDFRASRDEYHRWLREFFGSIQSGEAVDAASVELARQRLGDIFARQRQEMARLERKGRWRLAGFGFSVVGLGLGTAAALASGNLLAAGASVAGLVGLVTGKVAAPSPDRPPLTGASMFVEAERNLSWLEP